MKVSSILMDAMTILIQTLAITIIIIKSLDKKDNMLIRKIFVFNIIFLLLVNKYYIKKLM